jgi:hypothetical protein
VEINGNSLYYKEFVSKPGVGGSGNLLEIKWYDSINDEIRASISGMSDMAAAQRTARRV